MSQSPPFDDTVHLDDMPVDFSESDDTAAIVPNESPVAGRTTTSTTTENEEPETTFSQTTAHITVAILLLINLLNYMDRFTIAGKSSVISQIITPRLGLLAENVLMVCPCNNRMIKF